MHKLKYDRVITITLSIALLSMLIGLAVLADIKGQLFHASSEQYKTQQTQLANQIAETLTTNFINVQNQLQVMASMPEVQDFSDISACNAKLAELLSINQRQLGNLSRVNEQGIYVCSVNPNLPGQDSRQYGNYIVNLINDPNHGPVLGRLTRPAGADTHAVALHVPVYQDGQFHGTLGGALYFNKFQDGYLRNLKIGNDGHALLLDDNGDILFHQDAKQSGQNLLDPQILSRFQPQATMRELVDNVKAGRSGSFSYSVDGTPNIGLYKSFKIPDIDRHWAIIITIPTDDLEAVADQAGINRIFLVLVSLFSITTALLTFISLRNIMRDRELQRIKNDFISITSHQLRTPATIVKQNLAIVKDGYATTKAERQHFIEAAYESNENQLNIIENILNVSKLEAGRLELYKESVDLQSLVAKLADDLQLSAKARRHKLRVKLGSRPRRQNDDHAIKLQVDPTKLSMAIENLLSNAIKYTPAGGTITANVSHDQDWAYIAVSDTGQGISAEETSQLFQRFNRLRGDESSHVPGTGLGLYLTKKIIEMHGGRIDVESQLGKGTTFTIRLPR